MSSNINTIYDEFGNSSDWIEIFNSSDSEINLYNYYLSDDTLNPEKWRFSDLSLEANSYLLIFASALFLVFANSQSIRLPQNL